MKLVKILDGSYRGEEVVNQTFELVKDVTHGAKGAFITVRPNDMIGAGRDKIRINVVPDSVEYKVKPKKVETDEQIIARITERFEILDEMTKASVGGYVRAMILTGPAGIGKSYGVIKELEKANLFNTVKSMAPKYEVVKGAMSPIGLYSTLYNNSEKDNVLVFDDADGVLYDDLSLNLLKAAMDTSAKRNINWTTDSNFLEKEGIPNKFEFKGSIIFITNVQFDNIKSKKLQDHLGAIQSRCHYVDLAINTQRDKYLRIKQIFSTGLLFENKGLSKDQELSIMNWIDEHKDKVNELSLRLAIKCAELVKISPNNWKRIAKVTLTKG